MRYAIATIAYAAVLIVLGLVAYFGTGTASRTALIPSIIGGIFLVLGLISLGEKARRHALHAASALTLLAILGTASGLVKAVAMIFGAETERPVAVVVQAVTCVLSTGLLALYVKSFIDARRRRRAEAAGTVPA